MGRDFLLVNNNCFRESNLGRKFQFFHMLSLSAVEVKVKEHYPLVNSPGIPETHLQEDQLPMVDVSDSSMSSQMQDDQLSLSSCVLFSQCMNLLKLALRISRLFGLGKFFRTLLMDLKICGLRGLWLCGNINQRYVALHQLSSSENANKKRLTMFKLVVIATRLHKTPLRRSVNERGSLKTVVVTRILSKSLNAVLILIYLCLVFLIFVLQV